jgi:GT2 family glycosyltransferase
VQRKSVANEYLPFAATANALFRRSALEAVGGFEPALVSGGDVDCAWRIQVLTGGRVVLAPAAVVRHRHRRRVRTLVRQERRYAEGHGRLDRRWEVDPGYRAARGTARKRLRAAFLTPARVLWWTVTGRDPRIPLIDLAVRTTHELSRLVGRRRDPLAPLPPVEEWKTQTRRSACRSTS